MQSELWIWRPILAGKCTLEAVLDGRVGLDEIMKLNALLDMSQAYEAYSHEQSMKRSKK